MEDGKLYKPMLALKEWLKVLHLKYKHEYY